MFLETYILDILTSEIGIENKKKLQLLESQELSILTDDMIVYIENLKKISKETKSARITKWVCRMKDQYINNFNFYVFVINLK